MERRGLFKGLFGSMAFAAASPLASLAAREPVEPEFIPVPIVITGRGRVVKMDTNGDLGRGGTPPCLYMRNPKFKDKR